MNIQSLIIRGLIICITLIMVIRLFYIQVLDPQYRRAADSNIIKKEILYPGRGLIYDRNGLLLVKNEPIFDVQIVPKEFSISDSAAFCKLLSIDHSRFTYLWKKAVKYSPILPSVFIEQVSNEQLAPVLAHLINFNGVLIQPRTGRQYSNPILANALGYVGEISSRELKADTSHYYKSGDYIGITGLEKEYEPYLRGKRGIRYKTVDVQGREKGSYENGAYDSLPIAGENIFLTIDFELQSYAEKLLNGKIGSLVAIEPSSGEILAFVSVPTYDPNLLTGSRFSENFNLLASDSLNPLFARPIQAMYPPGSMFKIIQSLIAMQEGKLSEKEIIFCETGLIGDLAPPGEYDVRRAIMRSSNTYFYKIFRRMIQSGEVSNPYIDSRMGYEKWRESIIKFGLGVKTGIDLPGESKGFIPSIQTYDRIYGSQRWKFSNIYSLSIGQGELLVTPLQMANLGAILANRGKYYTPHFVKSISSETDKFVDEKQVGIDPKYFDSVIDGMEMVIKGGSGIRAYLPTIAICGKTSTVQNPHGEDHSGFMGFAPRENPKIAIAVYVENAGQGGRAAATTASLVIEKYLSDSVSRPWLEEYLLKGDFGDAKRSTEQ